MGVACVGGGGVGQSIKLGRSELPALCTSRRGKDWDWPWGQFQTAAKKLRAPARTRETKRRGAAWGAPVCLGEALARDAATVDRLCVVVGWGESGVWPSPRNIGSAALAIREARVLSRPPAGRRRLRSCLAGGARAHGAGAVKAPPTRIRLRIKVVGVEGGPNRPS